MKKVTKKTVADAKEKFPITADDLARNCADCPKPRKENRSQPTFTKFEIAALGAALGVICALAYAWFISDWLASL